MSCVMVLALLTFLNSVVCLSGRGHLVFNLQTLHRTLSTGEPVLMEGHGTVGPGGTSRILPGHPGLPGTWTELLDLK